MSRQLSSNNSVSPRRKPKRKIFVIAVVCVLLTTFSMYFTTMEAVAVEIDGTQQSIKTTASTVSELLVDVGVEYNEHDYLNVPLDTEITKGLELEWKPAHLVTLDIDGNVVEEWTTADTVAEFLNEEEIVLTDDDQMNVDATDNIKEGMLVSIDKAFPVTIADGGVEKAAVTTATTVADLLTENGVVVSEVDRVTPSLDTEITASTRVEVVRVAQSTITETTEIPFAVVEEPDANLEKGTSQVATVGVAGILSTDYAVVTENGNAVSKTVVNQVTVKEPVNQVVKIGTKSKPKPASKPAPSITPVSSGTTMTVESTAYTGGGITATGYNLNKNPFAKVIAVDPRVIPLGSKVFVEGYGYAIASDTGGAIKGNIIDVYLPTEDEAIEWGRKDVKITVY